MIKFGLSCNPGKRIEDEIELISGMGFDFAEITMEEPFGTAKEMWKSRNRIRNALEEGGIFATAHAPLDANLGSCFEPERKFWAAQSKKIMETADAIGVKKVNFHASYVPLIFEGVTKRQVLENHLKSFGALRSKAQILLENTHETLKDFRSMLASAKNVYATIDVGHAFMHGGNKSVAEYLSIPKLSHIHAHDNNGTEDEHLAVGRGRINFLAIGKELKRMNFDGTATLEVFAKNRALAKLSLSVLKKMWLA